MSELRRDYLESHYTLVPAYAISPPKLGGCAFCPGSESNLPPAEMVLKREKDGSIKKTEESGDERILDWDVKVVKCLSPLVTEEPAQLKEIEIPFRKADPVVGAHYVIIPTPLHDRYLSKMSIDDLALTLLAIQEFGKEMYQRKGVNYVIIYYEEKVSDGRHPLIHMLGLSELPPALQREIQAYRRATRESGVCPLCVIAEAERNGPRELVSNDQFISVFPWAPLGSYEAWILPFKHRAKFFRLTHTSLTKLAEVLASTLNAMAKVTDSYHMVFYTNSLKRSSMNIHWSIRVRDGGSDLEGITLSYGIKVYTKKPEANAKNLARHARKALTDLMLGKHSKR